MLGQFCTERKIKDRDSKDQGSETKTKYVPHSYVMKNSPLPFMSFQKMPI